MLYEEMKCHFWKMISANSHAGLVSLEVKFEARNGQKDGRDELKSFIFCSFLAWPFTVFARFDGCWTLSCCLNRQVFGWLRVLGCGARECRDGDGGGGDQRSKT